MGILPGLPPVEGRPVHLPFDGGRMTPDAGIPPPAAVETRVRRNGCTQRPCPHQIAHRVVCGIGYPDCRQLAGAMQPRPHQRVAAIRLDPVARPFIGISDGATTTHSCPQPVSNR
jgi:hypothetical protein